MGKQQGTTLVTPETPEVTQETTETPTNTDVTPLTVPDGHAIVSEAHLDALRKQVEAETRDKVLEEVRLAREKEDAEKAEADAKAKEEADAEERERIQAENKKLESFPYGNGKTGLKVTDFAPNLTKYPEDVITVLLAKYDTTPDGSRGALNKAASQVQFFEGPAFDQAIKTSANNGFDTFKSLSIEPIVLHKGKDAYKVRVPEVKEVKA